MGSEIRIGMSGWTFEGWRGDFYPKGLSQKKELEYASRKVNSIEINGTFYSLQKPETFARWHEETPDDFVFSVKGPQYITHIRRLNEVQEPLCNFFASGIFALKQKLGPILWQFPPNFVLKDDRVEKFLQILPSDVKSAEKLAKNHSDKVKGRTLLKASGQMKIRHAFEFRHPSFANPNLLAMLREYGVAWVFGHSGAEKSPYLEDLTSDFVYARMHGQDTKFKTGHTETFLKSWAERVLAWQSGKQPSDAQCLLESKPKATKRDIFIYFDTENKIAAPKDAMKLATLLLPG